MNQGFSDYFCMVIKIRIRIRIFLSRISDTSDYWIRIREGQKHVDPDPDLGSDPDPQYCILEF
jgi:hypothetical protein